MTGRGNENTLEPGSGDMSGSGRRLCVRTEIRHGGSVVARSTTGKGRIFFYRSTALGAGIQPDVRLNGNVVGTAVPHGVFYVDPDPGNMEVVTGSEVERKLTFTIAAGETRYVKLGVGLGVLVYRIIPELVSADEARKKLPTSHLSDLAANVNRSPPGF